MFKFIRRIITIVLTLIIAIPGYALFVTYNAAHNPTIRNAQVIVVPGAAQLNGAPGEVLLSRLQEAKRIYLLGLAPLIITVGAGAPGDRTTEAAAGAYWLRHNGVKRSAIISIPSGRDTRTQTIAYVAEMKKRKLTDVIIATDPYHCNRTISIAKDLGATATCSPVQDGPNSLKNSRFRYLAREAGAYLAYITLGKRGITISDHLPSTGL
ncbi:unannotated protein [freshwater metagenome]|uniref:Unannotated protein n=1 Tax=freshwater metagenome TaxID=449393 RepID=A0A6J7ESR2_9ZZZZ|nr:YdcF family protein [Actinomycetota bacterium]